MISDQKIVYDKYNRKYDIYYQNKPFEGLNLKNLLTQAQINAFHTGASLEDGTGVEILPGVLYNKSAGVWMPKSSIDYSALKSIGFYRLRNTISKLSGLTQVYIMVGNANAPSPIKKEVDVGGVPTIKESYLLQKDYRLFDADSPYKGIGNIVLPGEVTLSNGNTVNIQSTVDAWINANVDSTITGNNIGGIRSEGVWKWTWNTLVALNLLYAGKYSHYKNTFNSKIK